MSACIHKAHVASKPPPPQQSVGGRPERQAIGLQKLKWTKTHIKDAGRKNVGVGVTRATITEWVGGMGCEVGVGRVGVGVVWVLCWASVVLSVCCVERVLCWVCVVLRWGGSITSLKRITIARPSQFRPMQAIRQLRPRSCYLTHHWTNSTLT